MVPGLTAHWHADLAQIPADRWDELVLGIEGGTPFLRMGLLKAMVDSGSACRETGWEPSFLTLTDSDGRIQGACPLFLKTHSYGEYVFDWSWADAHDRALGRQGSRYYPKLLSAVPFSPIPGQRLLTRPGLNEAQRNAVRHQLLDALSARCQADGLSSAHILFLSETEADLARHQGWLVRQGVQFHWQNRSPAAFKDFDDFLASLHRDKRKKIQQERRKVREAGVTFKVLQGREIHDADWDFFAQCYAQTYHERGQQPYLSRSFWSSAAAALPDSWVLFIASQDGRKVASALLALDPQQKVAYGRYWGSMVHVPCLHFDACYYQPLAWCIDQGFRRFEGGAQGEHKMARGLLPVRTASAHWLAHPEFSRAVEDFLAREGAGMAGYLDELRERNPFKTTTPE